MSFINEVINKSFNLKSKLVDCIIAMARNSCYFNQLDESYPCMEPVNGDPKSAYCSTCRITISIKNKGKFDIEQHINSQKHQNNSKVTTAQKVFRYFHKVKSTHSPEDLQRARIEATWCFHNVKHSQSFRSMDCTSGLLKKFVDPKLSCAQTKTKAVITNVIAKWIDEVIETELRECNVTVLACDASNHKAIKLLPVLSR